MKEIKPFTAEDYFQQRFGKPDVDFFEDWTSKNIIEFAEAYHRGKIKEGVTEENLPIYNQGLNEGVVAEQERILGIIEEESERYRQLKLKTPNLGSRRDKHKYREFALRDIIQKIKGD